MALLGTRVLKGANTVYGFHRNVSDPFFFFTGKFVLSEIYPNSNFHCNHVSKVSPTVFKLGHLYLVSGLELKCQNDLIRFFLWNLPK